METEVKWCSWSVWGKGIPENVGQVFDFNEKSCMILYAEKQLYPAALWDMGYVNVFDTAEEAVINVLKNGHTWLHEIRNYWNFPSTEIDWDKMNKLEDEIINKLNGKN